MTQISTTSTWKPENISSIYRRRLRNSRVIINGSMNTRRNYWPESVWNIFSIIVVRLSCLEFSNKYLIQRQLLNKLIDGNCIFFRIFELKLVHRYFQNIPDSTWQNKNSRRKENIDFFNQLSRWLLWLFHDLYWSSEIYETRACCHFKRNLGHKTHDDDFRVSSIKFGFANFVEEWRKKIAIKLHKHLKHVQKSIQFKLALAWKHFINTFKGTFNDGSNEDTFDF